MGAGGVIRFLIAVADINSGIVSRNDNRLIGISADCCRTSAARSCEIARESDP